MPRRLIRRFALLLIAVLGFAHGAVALAGCAMERGGMAQMAEMDGDCASQAEGKARPSEHANRCVAHCTADLQLPGFEAALVREPTDAPVLILVSQGSSFPGRAEAEVPPPRTVPHRILLHSFLI